VHSYTHWDRQAWKAGSALVPFVEASVSLAWAGVERKVRQAADVVVRKVARLIGVWRDLGACGVEYEEDLLMMASRMRAISVMGDMFERTSDGEAKLVSSL
jgi:hypothetical protein